LHVLGRVVFVYELDVNTCWCICVLDDCLQLEPYACVFNDENDYVHAYLCKI